MIFFFHELKYQCSEILHTSRILKALAFVYFIYKVITPDLPLPRALRPAVVLLLFTSSWEAVYTCTVCTMRTVMQCTVLTSQYPLLLLSLLGSVRPYMKYSNTNLISTWTGDYHEKVIVLWIKLKCQVRPTNFKE